MDRLVDAKNGKAVAAAFSLSGSTLNGNAIIKPYDEMWLNHQKVVQEKKNTLKNVMELYKLESSALQAFLRSFSLTESNWEVPVLKVLSWNVWTLSRDANMLEDCARILSKAFTVTITDRASLEVSKKWGTLFIVNILLKIYFKLDNYRLCHNMLRAMENPLLEFPSLHLYPKSEEVTFRFYRARLHIHQNEFKKAEEHLEQALFKCKKSSIRNVRLILIYLIVVKMLHGKFPKKSILLSFDLVAQYEKLCTSVKTGDMFSFEQSLEENQKFFIKHELYLILQVKLKNLLYRNLFRKTYILFLIVKVI